MNGVSRFTGGLVGRGLNVENADVFHYEDDGATIVAVAAFAERGYAMPF
jgi:hypothetical protein